VGSRFRAPPPTSRTAGPPDRRGTADAGLSYDGRIVRVGSFPISIDTADIESRACDPQVQQRSREIRADLGNPELLLLGVDRLDYTKGIDQRVRAVGELFEEGTLRTPQHVMVQIAVPSREDDGHYQQERDQLERLVGEVNGRFAQVGHPAIHYLHRSVPIDELVALYLAADMMLVTPLRDEMNLVARSTSPPVRKRRAHWYSASFAARFAPELAQRDSRTQPARPRRHQRRDPLRDGPFEPAEARARMRKLRRVVHNADVFSWARSFLAALQEEQAIVLP
jgi:trehalose 6-phosphate synthase